MRLDFKPDSPDCQGLRPEQVHRPGARRRLSRISAAISLPILFALACLFIVPAAQARPAGELSPEQALVKATRAAEKQAEREERAAARKARREWPKEANAEWEHGTVQVTCTQVKWTFTNFPAAPRNTISERLTVDHAQASLTLSSFNGLSGTVTTNVVETPGRHVVKADAKWRTNGLTGHFVIHARISCPPAPVFTVEDQQEVAGAGAYTTSPITGLLGQTINYKVIATNTGNVPLNLSTFTHPGCDPGSLSGGTNPIAMGASATYFCKHVVTAADQTAGSISGTATLTGTPLQGNLPGVTHSSNTVTVNVPETAFTAEELQQVAGAGSYSTAPLTGLLGKTINHELLVTNTGNVPLTLGSFTDPNCDAGTVSGDTSTVAVGETVAVLCSHVITEADQSAGSLSGAAAITGTPPEGDGPAVTHTSNTLSVTVPTVAFSIEDLQALAGSGSYSTSPLTAAVGQKVDYEVLVRSTSSVALTLEGFADAGCDAGTVSGGVSSLAAGSTATYLCSHIVTATDQAAGSLSNSATVTGTPPEGDGSAVTHTSRAVAVTVPAPAAHASKPPTQPGTGVLGFKTVTVPSLSGPRGCVRAGFQVSVKSAGLASVIFYLDGHKLKALTAKNARKGKITLTIDPTKLGTGSHKLLARITMVHTASTSAVHASRTLIITRCRK